jgi:hypothetical protein
VTGIRVIRSDARSPIGTTIRCLARRLESRCRAAGLHFPETAAGLDQAGHLSRSALAALVTRLGSSSVASAEIVTHPGTASDPDRRRYRWGYEWADELDALCSGEVRQTVDRCGFRLGSFADLARS